MDELKQLNIDKRIKSKTVQDKTVKYSFLCITVFCSLIIVFIALFLLIKGLTPFFSTYEINGESYTINFFSFIFGGTWFQSPNIYGAGYIIVNTIYITLIALLIAVPVSVLTALFISRIAPKIIAKTFNSVVELLASIPSVIYGLFGMYIITSMVKGMAGIFNYQTAGGLSGLSAAIVLAMMIIPTITMISVTAIDAVKKDQILGSVALGASITQTNFKVVLTSAKSGIFSGIILGVGRALGEATAVSMVIGNSGSGPNFNIFDISRTLTSTMLLGIHETSGMDYAIRFSVGVVLIVIILVTNISLNLLKKKIGSKHEK